MTGMRPFQDLYDSHHRSAQAAEVVAAAIPLIRIINLDSPRIARNVTTLRQR